jgi:hypothetical protein
LSNGFSTSVDMIIYFMPVVWSISLIDSNIESILHTWNESLLVLVYNSTYTSFLFNLLIFYWKFCICICRDVGIFFPFLVMSCLIFMLG